MGTIGMLISECAYITQVYHIRKSKQVVGFSINFILLNLLGRLLSLTYAFYVGQLIFASTLLLGFIIRFIFLLQIMFYKNINFKQLIKMSINEIK
jgi:uncharacterized protein with PQ loop repeat